MRRLAVAAVVAVLALLAVAAAFGALPTATVPGGPAVDADAASAADALAWSGLPPLPLARTENVAAAAAGRIYVVGGLYHPMALAGDPGAAGTRVDVYDVANGTWARGPDLPLPLHHTAAVGLGTRVLVVGGHHGLVPFVPTPLTWWLDAALPLAEQRWEPFVPLPEPRGAHVAVTDGTDVYVFGGASRATLGADSLAAAAFVMRAPFSTAAPAWTRIADFPAPRDHLAGAAVDGRVYAVGGRELSLATNTGRLDVYDPATDAWTQGPDMPTPRGGIVAAGLGGRVLVFGGEGTGGTFDAVEAYDPATDAWTALPPMPEGRHGLGAASVGDAVHVLGGGPTPGFTFSDAHWRLESQR